MSAQKLQKQKIGLMQDLLTGQIPFKVDGQASATTDQALGHRVLHTWASTHMPWSWASMPSEPAGPAHRLPINITTLPCERKVEVKAEVPEPLHA